MAFSSHQVSFVVRLANSFPPSSGNHEYYHGPIGEWLEFFEKRLNMTVLRNSHRLITKGLAKAEVCVAGLDDLYTDKLYIEG